MSDIQAYRLRYKLGRGTIKDPPPRYELGVRPNLQSVVVNWPSGSKQFTSWDAAVDWAWQNRHWIGVDIVVDAFFKEGDCK